VKTNLKARNMDLSDRLRHQVERKLRRLERITHPEAEVEVELIANASHANDTAQVAEVTLVNNGQVLRSSAAGATPMAAFDIVIDKLERQLVRSKERPRSVRERRSEEAVSVLEREATKTVDTEEEAAPAGDEGTPSVVKIKRFDMLPMFEEDAIAQMEELGHAFFIFLSAETGEVAVIYRRNDGNYGLIEPVMNRITGRSR
jgi:putative sigma-54 modulation protein